ncbi:CAP domain-containing protein [Lactiplantibacillus carotarum]|uniref:CAP domain-containing protein n=1 Tax=Lactiplantibacillus carotarum TaxID=2993456 RepID=UPI00298EE37E|nr:CAP domain-containing protein [Lactiplantibacillus carotarum]
MAVAMLTGSVLTATTTVQASGAYRRTKITTTSVKPYYATSRSAKTYQLVGDRTKLKLKANHNLTDYRKTTWVRTKQTTITKHGKKYVYYYVTNAKSGDKGWTWHKYLKPGKNYQMTTPVQKTSKNYIKVKTGKLYQLNGNNNYMTFGKGTSLSSKKTYKATQKRYVYKQGKRYIYYYVTSSQGIKGWVNSSLVKTGSYKKTTKTVISKPKTTTTNKAVKTTKPVNPDKIYNVNVVASDLVTLINQARASHGSSALTVNSGLATVANQRGSQLSKDFAHEDSKGNLYAEPLAKQVGVWDVFATEDATYGGFETTNQALAKQLFENYMNSSDHWGDLMNGSFSQIGVGLYKASNGAIYNAVELGF